MSCTAAIALIGQRLADNDRILRLVASVALRQNSRKPTRPLAWNVVARSRRAPRRCHHLRETDMATEATESAGSEPHRTDANVHNPTLEVAG
jgi:hypothetical protein